METNSIFLSDGYKTGHAPQYPDDVTKVVTNCTPRSDHHAPKYLQGIGVVVFGSQMTIQEVTEHFDRNFFKTKERNMLNLSGGYANAINQSELKRLKDEVIDEIRDEFSLYLNTEYDTKYFEELWDLGYLPIEVRSLQEGTICPIRVPIITIHNTLPQFFWLTNYLETIISNLLWKPITSATISKGYKRLIDEWTLKTTGSIMGTEWMGHDFSMRGMDGVFPVIASGLGHLTSFFGTDSLPTLPGARYYYDVPKGEFIAGSVPATEHSVMCSLTDYEEIEVEEEYEVEVTYDDEGNFISEVEV